MSVPRRWLDDGGSATPAERDILRSALSVEPPPGAQGEVWAALLTKLPPAGPLGSGSSGPAATAGKAAVAAKAAGTAAIGGGVLKASLIGAGAALALITGYVGGSAIRHPSATTVPPAVTAPAHAQPTPAAPQGNQPNRQGPAANNPSPVLEGVTETTPPAPAPLTERRTPVTTGPQAVPISGAAEQAQRPVPNATDPGAERETMLQEESREMREAREALRRGDAAGALGMLEQIRARHPGGVLVQEREALTIEALAHSGRRAEASARAVAFLKAYPSSTLAEHVQAYAQ